MPSLKEYHLFISHAWTYSDEYNRLVNLLQNASYFSWKNYSVPKTDPLDTRTNKQLMEALHRQIAPTHAVIVLAGMYVAYRDWIQAEIDIAQEYGKPIIGVKPWGNERIPTAVSLVAKEIVNWQTSSLVDAIRKYSI